MTLSAFFVRVNEMWALEEEEIKFIYKMRLARGKFSRIFPIVFHSLGLRFFRFHLAHDTKANKEIVNDSGE